MAPFSVFERRQDHFSLQEPADTDEVVDATDGTVEIAYCVDPDYQGKGYATEAAEALVAFAFGSGRVRMVRAHTLPQSNASTRVLAKCGFRHISEVIEPEDGLVWRWEKHREPQNFEE